jgi:hypothetical protein
MGPVVHRVTLWSTPKTTEGHHDNIGASGTPDGTRQNDTRPTSLWWLFAGSKENGVSKNEDESARVYPFPAPVETPAELRTRLALADERA